VDAAHYRQLFVDLPVPWLVHVEGVVQDANRAAYELFRFPEGRPAAGTRMMDHVHPDSRESVRVRVRHLYETAQPVPATPERMLRCDGDDLWVETVASLTTFEGRPAIQVLCWDVTERVRGHERAQHEALHDPLTGLPNRAHLERSWQRMLEAGNGTGRAPALLFCDVDNFKTINDTYGHAVGDEVLKSVASRLLQAVRADDVVGRFGGDEFVVLLPTHPRALPQALVARIHALMRAPLAVESGQVAVAVSVGSAAAAAVESLADVLARADAQMYAVKQARRRTPD
jgi:diguanylate cyclase (GGDEF)-like protein/PAS domain S-box-containing protein